MERQAFEGVKVADFGWIATGPWICKYLAEYGAQVIRIESMVRPDYLRSTPPYKDNTPGLNRSGFFALFNNNKYEVSLNLKHPRGIEIAKKIVAWADIVCEGYSAGMMERWGLGYSELREVNPDIIMVSNTNQGQTGPRGSHPGMGVQLAALAGFTHLTGWPDRAPTMVWGAYTDLAFRFGLISIIAALDYRRRTGKGLCVDLSQYEASLQLLAPAILDFTVNGRVATRMGNRNQYSAPHGAYPCRGKDRWCTIAVFTDKEWQALCQVIGKPMWTKDPKFATLLSRKQNEDELDRLISQWTINFAAEEVMVMMQEVGIAAGVVQTCEDIYQDLQLKYRHYFTELEHPEIGKHHYNKSGFKLSRTPANLSSPAPCLGEHNEFVYTKVLGMPDNEFVELIKEGIIE